MTPAAKSRIWTVADFARFANLAKWTALRTLKRMNRELGGMLLHTRSDGKKPYYTLYPATLAKLDPDLMNDWESYDTRIAAIEERQFQSEGATRRLAQQTAANTRAIAGLQQRRRAA